jgi:hypothetical protein
VVVHDLAGPAPPPPGQPHSHPPSRSRT